MKRLFFLFLVCSTFFNCSSDDSENSKQINYIEVINNTATIHYNNNEKKVTSEYSIGNDFFSVTNWKKENFYINRKQVKEVENEKDSKLYVYKFHKGLNLYIIKR